MPLTAAAPEASDHVHMVGGMHHAADGGGAGGVDRHRAHLALDVAGQRAQGGIAAFEVGPEHGFPALMAEERLASGHGLVHLGRDGLAAQTLGGNGRMANLVQRKGGAAGHVLLEADDFHRAVFLDELRLEARDFHVLRREVRTREDGGQKADGDGDEQYGFLFHGWLLLYHNPRGL